MLFPASGGAALRATPRLVIRFSRKGCTNRPFYHIQVTDHFVEQTEQCIEQLGTYDPMPNERNERLLSCNFERIRYWMGEGANFSARAAAILGLAGFLPIHPTSYIQAWENRRDAELPEPPLPKKLTWRERKKILMKQAEENMALKNTGESEQSKEATDNLS